MSRHSAPADCLCNALAAEFLVVDKKPKAWVNFAGTPILLPQPPENLPLSGTPKNGRNVRPGEWLAPEPEGAVSYALNKGDMLVVTRGTPHKRITKDTVTLPLVSPMGSPKA